MTTEPRHAFFETDDRVELNIFIKDVPSDEAKFEIEPRKFRFSYSDKELLLDPLRGEIDPEKSETKIGKVKIEVKLTKTTSGRWGGLVGEATTSLSSFPESSETPAAAAPKPKKNWESVATQALNYEKEKTTTEDPNVGGDAAVNSFFQQIYGGADEDTRRAMIKSYTESGGTALSTDWKEVAKGKVEAKPPKGAEVKK